MLDKIRNIIQPILEQEDTELVDIIFHREAGRQVLRLLVDKEGGIKLYECVKLNQRISRVLEEGNAIAEDYVLEVASPGIDRPFKTKRDYMRAAGRMVRVTLSEAILNKKEYIGRLKDIMEDSIRVDVGKKGIIEVPFSKITRVRQEVEF
ncbi:MAG: ribosome maturation factor RimP [Candidatus Omnitrophica bacterium]|nr:ribosome maturation factor RimP [Candidatus Omnitrophota bacterium]